MAIKRENVKKGTRVEYTGSNRTYLKQYPEAKLNGEYSEATSGAFVLFYNDNGLQVDQAWVGINYLNVVGYKHQKAIDELTTSRDDLNAQIQALDTAISSLKALG